MWALSNQTPYGAGRNWIRDKHGAHLWIVAVKASFVLDARGKVVLDDVQQPPPLAPEYHGKPGGSSLRCDSDLLRAKPCTDVVASGHAHAPRGVKAASVSVSLRVAGLHKQLIVHGSRVYYKDVLGGLTTSTPQPFESRPVRYESAYGGMDVGDPDPGKHRIDARNPIGVGFATNPARLIHEPAPTVVYPSGNPAELGPAGFGPIDPTWSPRRELAGTYDAAWAERKKPLLADDYHELHAACAPSDQRVGQLLGAERVELLNLTREGVLRFELPKLYLTFVTRFGRRYEEHRASITSLVLEPERMGFSMVWQSALPVPSKRTAYLDQTVIREKRGLQ